MRAMWRVLETGLRNDLYGHEGETPDTDKADPNGLLRQLSDPTSLTLAESKRLLDRVHQELVESQVHCHAQEQRICAQCGGRRALKDYRLATDPSMQRH